MKIQKTSRLFGALLLAVVVFLLMPAMTVEAAPNADGSVTIDATNFPDDVFREYVLNNYDLNADGVLSLTEGEKVDTLWLIGSDVNGTISSLQGIEYFPQLRSLFCSKHSLTQLDISHNPELKLLSISENQLTTLDVSHNPALETLACSQNALTSLDVSHNPALVQLSCYENSLTSLDVSYNPALQSLMCENNNLTELKLSQHPALFLISCYDNALTSLNVSQCPVLETLHCYENQLLTLDVSQNPLLESLGCQQNQLSELNLLHNPALVSVRCSNNKLSALNVSNLAKLRTLDCYNNSISALDVSQNPELKIFLCNYNKLNELDVSSNTVLERLNCSNNNLTDLDVSNNTKLGELDCYHNQLTDLDVSSNTELTTLLCFSNKLTTLDLSNNINITRLNSGNNAMEYIDVSMLTLNGLSRVNAQEIDLGKISGGEIQLGSTGNSMDFSRVTDIKGATYDTATGKLTDYTTSPIKYTYEAVAADGKIWEVDVILKFTTEQHTHSYGTSYESDADNHWNECECGATGNVAAHTPGPVATEQSAQTCTVCRYEIAPMLQHTHSYRTAYSSDADNHWNECACGADGNMVAHSFEWITDKEATESEAGSKHEECSVCGYEKAPVEIPKLTTDDDSNNDTNNNTNNNTNTNTNTNNTGSAPVQNPVTEEVKDDVLKTGDSPVIPFAVAGCVVALGGIAVLIYFKKKESAQ